MEVSQHGAQFTQAAGDYVENRLVGVSWDFLLQMGDPQRFAAPDLTAVRHCRTRYQPEQSRFSCAVAADEANPLTSLELEVDAGDER
jgi:hypothetical protein